MIAKRMPIIGPLPTNREEWLAARQKIITATDMARIMAGEGFVVFAEKTGQSEPFSGNKNTRRGKRFERPTLEEYADEANAFVCDGLPFLIDPDCPSLGATPDAVAMQYTGDPSDEGAGRLGTVTPVNDWWPLGDPDSWGVEAKTSISADVAAQLAEGDDDSDFVPDAWMVQDQCQAAVCGWEVVDMAIFLFGRLRLRRVLRNDKLIDFYRATAVEYAERIAKNLPPPINFDREACQSTIRSLYGSVDDSQRIELSCDAVAAWNEYKRLGPEQTAIEKERKRLQSIVLAELQNAGIGLSAGKPFLKRKIVQRGSYEVSATSYPQLTAIKG